MTSPIDRRRFLAGLIERGVDLAAATFLLDALTRLDESAGAPVAVHLPPVEAEYYEKSLAGAVTCHLCPRQEHLSEGDLGFCHSRKNEGGILKTYASGQPCVMNLDPIEKNPACHVLPGRKALTIAHAGCNLRCQYCQNWEFSQKCPTDTNNLRYDQDETLQLARQKNLVGVTFTYTEGTTHIEFNKKLARAARAMGLKAFLCTNGYVQERPLQDFLELLDAVTVTIKSFRDATYQKYTAAEQRQPVLDSCKRIRQSGKWLEIATLIVPGVNDDDEEISDIARWIRENLGPHTPWHLERFTPKYMLANLPQTSVKTMERARNLGLRAGLKFVYLSNLAPHEGNHTYCPKCNREVISRLGIKVLENRLRNGRCPWCRTSLPGMWD